MQRRGAVLVVALVNVATLVAGISVAVVFSADLRPGLRVVERTPVDAPPVFRRAPQQGKRTASGTPRQDGQGGQGSPMAGPVRKAMQSPSLGSRVSAMVIDPASGQALLRERASSAAIPASATKILTGAAALAELGPGARFTTEVVRTAGSRTITLVGGGDPTLASPEATHSYPKPAQLGKLAKKTAAALRQAGVGTVRLRYDASLFRGPDTASSWKPSYVSNGYVAPVTALSVDAGREEPTDPDSVHPGPADRVSDPSEEAAQLFATLLREQGVTVRGDVVQAPAREGQPSQASQPTASKPDSTRQLAAVRSPTVAALVAQMLADSNNDLAEALGRHVALAAGKRPSFRGGAAAVEQAIGKLGVPVKGLRLRDCSGLSRENRVASRTLARTLQLAAGSRRPELRSLITGLPVAGYSGTLYERYQEDPAAAAGGLVRAKTGTLSGVSALAGVAYRPDGRMLVFAFLADRVPSGALSGAREALDEMAAALIRR